MSIFLTLKTLTPLMVSQKGHNIMQNAKLKKKTFQCLDLYSPTEHIRCQIENTYKACPYIQGTYVAYHITLFCTVIKILNERQ